MYTENLKSISNVKNEFSKFLGELFNNAPDEEVSNCGLKIETEFKNLEAGIETKNTLSISDSVNKITSCINQLIEKFKHLAFGLKLAYLKEKFEACVYGAPVANCVPVK